MLAEILKQEKIIPVLIYGDYIVIDGLDVQGGMRGSIGLDGADYCDIKNCNIGKYSNWVGIEGNSTSYNNSSGDKTSDYDVIENNIVYSAWNYQYYSYTARTPYGIYVGNGASYWKVRNNFIKDWWMGVFGNATDDFGVSYSNEIYNNEITSPDFCFSKGIQTACPGGVSTSYNKKFMRWRIFNNYIHDAKACGMQIGSSGNFIYFNTISNIGESTNIHGGSANGIVLFPDDYSYANVDSNYIFNNTIYNVAKEGEGNYGVHTVWYNNMVVNTAKVLDSKIQTYSSQNAYATYKNNMYFYSGLSTSALMFQITDPQGNYTISEWNGLDGSYNLKIENEMQYVGPITNLINTNDFTLPNNSPAINAGVNISNIIPPGFQDRYGNIINVNQPNIGAIDNKLIQPTGFKVFLEGPYKNGLMSTILNDNNYIPKSQPYNIKPWYYNGDESVSSIPKDVVDWILVELRYSASPNTIIARKAAFLKSDGTITALDGVSSLTFSNSLTDSFYVVIKHRNHLAIMSSSPIALINGCIKYDFTTSENKAYGQNSMIELGNGIYGMYGGDSDGNGIIEDNDVVDVSKKLFTSGYIEEDSDMNSPVNVLDYKLPNLNMSKFTNVK